MTDATATANNTKVNPNPPNPVPTLTITERDWAKPREGVVVADAGQESERRDFSLLSQRDKQLGYEPEQIPPWVVRGKPEGEWDKVAYHYDRDSD